MSTLDQVAGTAPPTKSMRLINSINELPYYGGRPDEAFIVSGLAMKEITEELQRLWQLREVVADVVRRARPQQRDISAG